MEDPDHLDQLGIAWNEEDDVRNAVVAKVTSAVDHESLDDQRKIKAAWAALEAAEQELERGMDTEPPPPKAKMDWLTRNVEIRAKEVEQLQRQAELNDKARIQKAKADIAKEEKAEIKARDEKKHHAQKLEAAVKEEPRTPTQPTIDISRSFFRGVHPEHVRGVAAPGSQPAVSGAVMDYRGGAVLPSAHHVGVSVKRMEKKYIDDGDASRFERRQHDQQKRRHEDGGERDNTVEALPGLRVNKRTWESLLDYQKVGVEWMWSLHTRQLGGILGDEMGLGKTVQTATYLSALHASGHLVGPVLIVAPVTIMSQWVGELHKWAPLLRSCVMHSSGSSSQSREEMLRSVRGMPSVVITTYATVTFHYALLMTANFQYVILDEGHKINNPEAAITVAVKTLTTPHRLILSGSPIQNTLTELWSLFDFVAPGRLGSKQRFIEEFEEPIKASRSPTASALVLQTSVECAHMLRELIQPYLLRRLKKDVNRSLPPKHERVIKCAMTDAQLAVYVDFLMSPDVQELLARHHRMSFHMQQIQNGNNKRSAGDHAQLVGGDKSKNGVIQRSFTLLFILRSICNHTDLRTLRMEDAEEGGSGKTLSFRSNRPVSMEGSAKLIALRKLLRQWKHDGHKALVFSQSRMMLDIIENMVEQDEYTYIRMDGLTPSKHRVMLIDRFNADASVFVALLTTRVGGLGVNLTGADRVVIFDPDWNPITDSQARERAWRIGQTREVCIYRMITSGSVEEHILLRQMAKTFVTEKVLQDPSLQRFYHIHSLLQSFLIGDEYAARLPRDVADNVCCQPQLDLSKDEESTKSTSHTSGSGTIKVEVIENEPEKDADTPDVKRDTSLLADIVDGRQVQLDHASSSVASLARHIAHRRAANLDRRESGVAPYQLVDAADAPEGTVAMAAKMARRSSK